jgi:hypothetical protein
MRGVAVVSLVRSDPGLLRPHEAGLPREAGWGVASSLQGRQCARSDLSEFRGTMTHTDRVNIGFGHCDQRGPPLTGEGPVWALVGEGKRGTPNGRAPSRGNR